jgi:lipid-binding SYLF domain-containing protein
MINKFKSICSASVILAMLLPTFANADSAEVTDTKVNETIEIFKKEVNGADVFLSQSAGYLVFPRVIKIGIGVGGETGEGALRVGGVTDGYYRTSSGSIGFQLGAQAKSIVIAFMTKEALNKFRDSDGWKIGLDGSVALIDLGAGKTIDSHNIKDPVVGFIFGSKGLMYNLTLEGSKIHRQEGKSKKPEEAASEEPEASEE